MSSLEKWCRFEQFNVIGVPKRFLKPGITTSKRWDSCSWFAQSFYVRLITLVDDYGRYDADPMLLRAHAFPLRDDIRTQQVQELCRELSDSQLAVFYKSDGKDYLQLLKWEEKPRALHSKYPTFTKSCEQMFADARKCDPPSLNVPRSSSSPPILASKAFNVKSDETETVNARNALNGRVPDENRLMETLSEILGSDEMARSGGNWRVHWVRKHPDLVESAVGELRYQVKTGATIENRGAWLMDYLKRRMKERKSKK